MQDIPPILGTVTSQMAQVVKNPFANAGDTGNVGSIPGSGRSPGGGNGSPLQYSCLENPIDRGAWRAKVHEITELDTAEVSEHICVRIIYFCLILFLYW